MHRDVPYIDDLSALAVFAAADSYFEGIGLLPVDAVRGCEDDVRRDEGSSAEVRVVLHGDRIGPARVVRLRSADDSTITKQGNADRPRRQVVEQ